MATLTSRLKLRKPDPTDLVSVTTDLDNNFDAIDAAISRTVCTSGTRPGTPYQGQEIFETDTGNTYVWTGSAWAKELIDSATGMSVSNSISSLGNISATGDMNMATPYSHRNAIQNGDMQVWQRGAGPFAAAGYTADRWRLTLGTGATCSVAQSALTLGAYNDHPKYALSFARTVAGTTDSFIEQRIEGVQKYSGKQIQISAMIATTSGSVDFTFKGSQVFGTGGSPSSTVNLASSTVQTATTSWTKFTFSVTPASISGKTLGTNGDDYLSIVINRAFNATNGAATGTLLITDVQVEAGSLVTPYERKPYHVEYNACLRHYYRLSSASANHFICNFSYISTTVGYGILPHPQTLRAAPSGVAFSAAADITVLSTGSVNSVASSTAGSAVTKDSLRFSATTPAVGAAGNNGYAYFNSATAWLEVTAEL